MVLRSLERKKVVRKVIVVSENSLFREGLRHLLGTAPDINVLGVVSSLDAAVQLGRDSSPDVVVVDAAKGTAAGRALLSSLLHLDVGQVIVVTLDDQTITAYRRRDLPDASADTLLDLLADDS
jgi:DNA-binding NarL/FixJ family response regulator